MSIRDHNDNEIVTLNTVNAWAFKAAIWFAPLFALWMVTTVLGHDKTIGMYEWRLSMIEGRKGAQQTTSVNVGSATAKEINEAPERRGYYLTSEIAALLKKSERTVQEMCATGAIPGATQPEGGRGWRIPLDFQVRGELPQTAAISGKEPQPEGEER